MSQSTMQNLNSSLRWDTNAASLKMAAQMSTPRPAPQFFQQAQTFSTKKDRGGTPRDRQPPRPPIKSAPPISRIFPHKTFEKALPVSFKSADTSLQSVHYNEGIKDLYFDQCFQIESKLGAGSFGEVFKVRSREDGKLYAVKRSRERFRGESDRKRKLEEVAKHEQLPKHPNCVRFIKAWEEKQHLYIQTELCRTSLQYLSDSNHNIPESLVWNYLVDLLMAVKHLHDHDLVHMDIKPENIFISDDDTCKLGDFGLVLDLVKRMDRSEAQEGDPRYLSPELMNGQFGPPADVFSLGISILELVTDIDLPRGGELWHQLRSGSLPEEFLIGVSVELKSVIRSMMEPDARLRPTVKEVLQHPFVVKIWRRRRRAQLLRRAALIAKLAYTWFIQFFITLFMAITLPVHSVLPEKLQPAEPAPSTPKRPQEWDYSFSDDELGGEDDINISNNSMGVPLNLSTSSEDSLFSPDGFAIPSIPPRRGQTTPGCARWRPVLSNTPVSLGSPELSSLGSHYSSSSPISSSRRNSFSRTPNTSFSQSLIEDDDLQKCLGIGPKNLLDVFETEPSDED